MENRKRAEILPDNGDVNGYSFDGPTQFRYVSLLDALKTLSRGQRGVVPTVTGRLSVEIFRVTYRIVILRRPPCARRYVIVMSPHTV